MAHVSQPEHPQLLANAESAKASPEQNLGTLLHAVFGHSHFRPHQQAVCEDAAAGRDVLLVMPTGAGKSLCYQLPALARGGTALVISPLIALMEDQAQKLSALNLRIACIHSGLPRENLREAARAYLEGRLDFLFIAPERLRVSGFPEMLARRKPALIAIDEAHCISQWGHDFRPDYRTLGQFLPALRPSPIIALTATATPAVQRDILRALNLKDPSVFITGFRRTNLQIEIVEVSKPQRPDLMRKLLAPDAARPAIIYAQSRKTADEIASMLGGHFPCAAYHAGLDPGIRDRVQRAFLSGKLDVVVATVAFGMGVDKADVRTVIHAALPGSVEAYYQEIGRAGRDGNLSRVVLLHSFADRRTLEFFLEKNYPPVPDIERVLAALNDGVDNLADLQQHLKMDREMLEQSIDKLLIQAAVLADLDGTIRPTSSADWKQSYEQQIGYRRTQIDKIVAYAEGATCRMTALIHHFGDRTDSGLPCGHCDICCPATATAVARHQATETDKQALRELLGAIPRDGRSIGRVFSDLGWSDRKRFHVFVDALAQAGLVSVVKDSFRNPEGEQVTYQKLVLTLEGRDVDDLALNTVYLKDSTADRESPRRADRSTTGNGPIRRIAATGRDEPLNEGQQALEQKLKAWRLATARANGIAPFMIFHDSVLRKIAEAQVANVKQLEAIRGIGQDKSDRYGADLLAICRGEGVIATPVTTEPSLKVSPKLQSSSPRRAEVARPGILTERERGLVNGQTRGGVGSPVGKVPAQRAPDRPLSRAVQQLETKLRDWRSEEATIAGLPSFFVLSDTAIKHVAATQPASIAELTTVPGFGPDKVERYGAALIDLCRGAETLQPPAAKSAEQSSGRLYPE